MVALAKFALGFVLGISISCWLSPYAVEYRLKDRDQWLGREFRGSLSLNMDKLFLKAIIYELYH